MYIIKRCVLFVERERESTWFAHFVAIVNDLFEHVLRDVGDGYMVGITIRNQVNQNVKPIGISFRRKDQLSAEVLWSVFEKLSQSNSRFDALDTLFVTVHSVRMPVSLGKRANKNRGRPFSVMAHLKTSIVEVKAEENCLAHALVISIAKVENDPDYKAYRQGRKIRQVVQTLLETTSIDLSKEAGIPELVRFQEHFRQYKIVVYRGQSCEDIMFEGRVDSPKRLNILYDEVERHYHVIAKLTGAMVKNYVCKGCSKACKRDIAHVCNQTCSDSMVSPPCAFAEDRIPCDDCHRHIKNAACFANHNLRTMNRKSVCERKRCCEICGWLVTHEKHECYKRFCDSCKENKEI